MPVITKGLLAIGGLLMALTAGPALLPMEPRRVALERQLGAAFGRPVSVHRFYFALLPYPQFMAEGIVDHQGTLRIARAQALPELPSLLSNGRAIVRELRIQDGHMDGGLLQALLEYPVRSDDSSVLVRYISVEDCNVRVGDVPLTDIDASIHLGTDGRPLRINASMDAKRLHLEVLPTASGALQLAVQGSHWTAPFEPRLRFEQIEATALLEANHLKIWNLQATLDGGGAYGFLSARWRPTWAITGELSLHNVAIAALLPRGDGEPGLDGRLQATPRFVMRARRADRLLDSLELASDFTLRDAIVRKVDLAAAGDTALPRHTAPPVTHLDEVSGHLVFRRGRYELHGLQAHSGALSANGRLSIAADRSLAGQVDVQLRDATGFLGVPLRVSGSLDDPQLVY